MTEVNNDCVIVNEDGTVKPVQLPWDKAKIEQLVADMDSPKPVVE